MHELGIAQSLLDTVEKEAARHPGARVSRVGIRIGELSAVDADALGFCFAALIRQTAWEPLALDIEPVRHTRRCRQCGLSFAVENFARHCPACASPDTAFLSGDELNISYLEVDLP